ncbi:MAG: hypothetical protein ACLS3M_03660 [Collinsella sp.]
MATLPDDLRNQIRSVRKLTNNTGGTKDVSSITATDDILWLPSMSELCGYQAPKRSQKAASTFLPPAEKAISTSSIASEWRA